MYDVCGVDEIVDIAACASVENYRGITTMIACEEVGKMKIPADNIDCNLQQQSLNTDIILTGPALDTSVRAQTMSLTALTRCHARAC